MPSAFIRRPECGVSAAHARDRASLCMKTKGRNKAPCSSNTTFPLWRKHVLCILERQRDYRLNNSGAVVRRASLVKRSAARVNSIASHYGKRSVFWYPRRQETPSADFQTMSLDQYRDLLLPTTNTVPLRTAKAPFGTSLERCCQVPPSLEHHTSWRLTEPGYRHISAPIDTPGPNVCFGSVSSDTTWVQTDPSGDDHASLANVDEEGDVIPPMTYTRLSCTTTR